MKLDSSICLKLKEARRAAKLSQGELAAEVGCKQSAISMFEAGDGTKLSEETVKKIAEKFGVSLEAEEPAPAPAPIPLHVHGFCPNHSCPSNHHYMIDGRDFYKIDVLAADPVMGKFCALCGEVLEKRCPNCCAALHEGAICSFCGEPYVR